MVGPEEHGKLFFLSLLLHLAILALFIVSFEWSARNFVLENSKSPTTVINATVMNNTKIKLPEPIKPAKVPPPQKREEAKPIVKPIKKLVEPIIQKKTIAIPDPHKKQIQNDIEKQLLADLEQIKKQKKKKHKEIEKALQKELKASAAKSLEQQLLEEKNRLTSAQAEKMQGIVDKYKALILQAIGQHWLVPLGANKSLSTELLIRIAPGGTVLDVQLVKSSGDDSLDRSARTAIFKASPLPVPSQAEEFELFRQFILKMKPENIVARDSGLS